MGGNILNQVYSGRLTAASPSIDLAALGLLLGRICFAADFLLFGARKFSDPSIIYKLIVAHHLPGELVYPAMFLQLVGGTCILLGLQTRFWSAAFAGFCIVAPSIFWLDNLENLTRDYAAAGGFLFLLLSLNLLAGWVRAVTDRSASTSEFGSVAWKSRPWPLAQ